MCSDEFFLKHALHTMTVFGAYGSYSMLTCPGQEKPLGAPC